MGLQHLGGGNIPGKWEAIRDMTSLSLWIAQLPLATSLLSFNSGLMFLAEIPA